MLATLHIVRSQPLTLSPPQRRVLLTSAMIGGAMLALLSLVETTPAHAQTVRITDKTAAPRLVNNPIETLALRITAAHRIATDTADALVYYVSAHQAEVDRVELTTHSDAIGHSLDRAAAASVELATIVQRSDDRRRVIALQKYDEAARDAHETLSAALDDISLSIQELEATIKDLKLHVQASEREVTALCADLELSCGGNLVRTASR